MGIDDLPKSDLGFDDLMDWYQKLIALSIGVDISEFGVEKGQLYYIVSEYLAGNDEGEPDEGFYVYQDQVSGKKVAVFGPSQFEKLSPILKRHLDLIEFSEYCKTQEYNRLLEKHLKEILIMEHPELKLMERYLKRKLWWF